MGKFVRPQHMPSTVLTCPRVPTKTGLLLFLNINLHVASGASGASDAGEDLSERTERGNWQLLCNFEDFARGNDDVSILSLKSQLKTATRLSGGSGFIVCGREGATAMLESLVPIALKCSLQQL